MRGAAPACVVCGAAPTCVVGGACMWRPCHAQQRSGVWPVLRATPRCAVEGQVKILKKKKEKNKRRTVAVVAYPCRIEAEGGQVEGDRALTDLKTRKTKKNRKKTQRTVVAGAGAAARTGLPCTLLSVGLSETPFPC